MFVFATDDQRRADSIGERRDLRRGAAIDEQDRRRQQRFPHPGTRQAVARRRIARHVFAA
jgi:hypothetical protein